MAQPSSTRLTISQPSTFMSFVVGILVLAYLFTFVLFAVIRILWGVSIQRLWWSGLRRISFTPREGLRVDIRGLRLSIHRPTFAQPTWVSVVVTELKVTVDFKSLGAKPVRAKSGSGTPATAQSRPTTPLEKKGSEDDESGGNDLSDLDEEEDDSSDSEPQKSRTWKRLTELKEQIKRLHRQIQWIRLVDFIATNTAIVVVDVGSLQVASFTMAVDTRRRTVDRSRLFQHRRAESDAFRPAEWILTARGILFALDGDEASEILDHATLNIHGLLSQRLEGLRDASIALKFGRLSLPYDDLFKFQERMDTHRATRSRYNTPSHSRAPSFTDIVNELDEPGSAEETIVQAVSDSKEFISSILRGIQEVQFAVGFIGLSKRIRSVQKAPVYLNMSMKEVGLDVLRLDPKEPAHLMYFSRTDVAHQALLTVIAISVGIDDGHDHPERLFYVPMATATIKSTLPSKTIQFTGQKNVAERNTNILFANLVVTSPSIDIEAKHPPFIISLLQNALKQPSNPPRKNERHHIISRLLPKASVKISVHEPVIRARLPCMEIERRGNGEFDLLIGTLSSISLDMESSHSGSGDLHYSLSSNLRVASNQLYYQTASGEKHNLLITESLELKFQMNASPEVAVVVSGNVQTLSVFMVRPEISEGVRLIVTQLRSDVLNPPQSPRPAAPQPSFLRRLPSWLLHVQLQGSDFNFEVAGNDPGVSQHARGAALHLESCSAEYKANKHEEAVPRPHRRRAVSRSIHGDDIFLKAPSSSPSRKSYGVDSDNRHLAIQTNGLEAFVIESSENWEPESFLSLPRFEIGFSTASDQQGQCLNVNANAKALYVQYSLYRHYALGVATMVLRKTFSRPHSDSYAPEPRASLSPTRSDFGSPPRTPSVRPEIVNFDFRAGLVQIKATMPADPPLMIQVFSVEAGRHRWAIPYAKARLVRLYAESPHVRRVWARIISIRGLRVDYRLSRRKYGTGYVEDRSLDIVAEAIRVAVPHQLVVHKIFDNLTNVAKTVEQLHHRFRTETDEYILEKKPQGPKKVPKISLRTQAFLFEIEDSPFEWKFGLIYLQGLQEQRQRLARDEAFQLKVRAIEEADVRRGSSRFRAKSSHTHHGRGRHHRRKMSEGAETTNRSKSVDPPRRSQSAARSTTGKLRYDAEGTAGLSDKARTSIEDAKEKLDKFNAQSWKKRINTAYKFQKTGMQDLRSTVWGLDETPDDVEHTETILGIPERSALMSILVNDLNILIDKPSFPLHEYPSFLHKMGKGIPFDMEYSLLIPMSLNVGMGEARMTLRDYPLPLMHFPPLRSGQSPRMPAVSARTDFVIAEEFRHAESIRHVTVGVVPPERLPGGDLGKGLIIDVRRTVSAVKTYSNIAVEVNTSNPTRITWGTSYQPAIQDMMQVVENFTKPPVDPSERVGFWDKIRLTFHSAINVIWKGDGDVHLILKGSRDPYHVTDSGAGFVMCWRGDVKWGIAQSLDPKKFMTVDSNEYVLAIPNLARYARRSLEGDDSDNSSISSTASYEQGGRFKKTVMKLSGNVRWIAGLVFERNVHTGGRSFQFRPHYEVALKNPEFARPGEDGQPYDAYQGFRSHYIHLSVGISAPSDKDWTVTNIKPSKNYNSVHLTPRFFSHFFSWWSMFSGSMSLPIRQGKLFPGVEKSSKKFGRHLATIKYSLLLSPLYLAHIYKHQDLREVGISDVSATGLKVKLDSFMLDLHQRREEFRTQVQGKQTVTSAMRINQAQLDFVSADVRAVSAKIASTTAHDVDEASEDMLAAFEQAVPKADLSRFIIPDRDTDWVDMDDFVEIDWILPGEPNAETKILPLAYAPRFTYFRNTDHHSIIARDPSRSSPFGNEDTHYCVMSARNDPHRVQCDLIQERLDRIAEQLAKNRRNIGEQELNVIRDATGRQEELKSRLEAWQTHNDLLTKKQKFLQAIHKVLLSRLGDDAQPLNEADQETDAYFEAKEDYDPTDPELLGMDSAPLSDDISDFNNRFIVHNMQLKWNNSLRDIIIRYVHQVSQRRGFVYYMSRRAVKFILDIVEEQRKAQGEEKTDAAAARTADEASSPTAKQPPQDDDDVVQGRIEQLLGDAKRFVSADEAEKPNASAVSGSLADEDISRDYVSQKAYHVRLIAPQIQLQSEKNTKSAVLVTSKGMQLKVFQIMDKDRVTDEVSGLVQHRFTAAMDSVQIFVTSSQTFSKEFLDMYSANRYGARYNSSWPPWVPLEVMFDFNIDPYGFSRVVERTSMSMRLDKYNTLRLKYTDDLTSGKDGQLATDGSESQIDHLWVNFPKLHAVCNSVQYYALYIIVLDLLLYNEPFEKTRSERLEKIMLASDFSDLSGAPEMVNRLQEKIRTLQEIKMLFQINERSLTRQQWKDRIMLEDDLAQYEDQLFFIMKAITTSQRRYDERAPTNQSAGLLHWEIAAKELVWHLVRGEKESLVELQLKDTLYNRTDNNDGSNNNSMEIGNITGYNLLPDAVYPVIIAPFTDDKTTASEGENRKMLSIHWYMLEAIAGIPVMERFEVNIVPLKIQLEREVGQKVFEYIFPGITGDGGEGPDFSPFIVKHMLPTHQEADEESPDTSEDITPNGSEIMLATDEMKGVGDLSLRLQPTLTLPDNKRPGPFPGKTKPLSSHHDLLRLRHLSKDTSSDLRRFTVRRKDTDSISLFSRPGTTRSSTMMSDTTEKDTAFGKKLLHRSNSALAKGGKAQGRNDDIAEMLSRANKYMTLAYVKIPSMVLCLSFKGKGNRNIITDVHDLVFRMPTLEYRNKTWSNLDLVMQLKKEVMRALLSHTGAILGNKFHTRPSKQQQSKLRELASSSIMLGAPSDLWGPSEAPSLHSSTVADMSSEAQSTSEPRQSFGSGRDSEYTQYPESMTSSMSHGERARPRTSSGAAAGLGVSHSHSPSPGPAARKDTDSTLVPASPAPSEASDGRRSALSQRLAGFGQKALRHGGDDGDRRRSRIPLPKFLNGGA
ncbi:hypothetical protein EJ06DRAFT_532660 [Trichodelitschia bisporula]|uniref:Mitochondrial protein from FMP27-domain-containing protein n=1 Tax=Trichodelitschia bisporula TaxID=703511 RepID=A0A6G1HP85_9PEZI|nr:hypothetical protein EJ06DRAFT_532660 [Trichodelitschia bisporula]